jgi:4-amino-4-deoxy-L-arabinose transferase-like glycosyltransferase
VGVLAGVPWLVSPVIAGATILISHALVARLYDRLTAHAVAALLAFSPWLLYLSAEMMSQPLALFLGMSMLLAVERARSHPGGAGGTVAGLLFGAMGLTRPLDAAFFGAVTGAWALGVGGVRLHGRDLAAGVAATALVAALALPYNAALTGRALLTPHRVFVDRAFGPGVDRLGFGAEVGIRAWPNLDPLPGHGPADVVLNLNKNAFQANADLFGWSFGSLLPVFAGLLAWRWRRPDGLFLAIVAGFAAGYSLYWFSGGPDFGARYWYPAMVPMAVVTVRAARAAAERLAPAGEPTQWRMAAWLGAATACATLTVLPWRALTKYHRYRDVSADVRRLAARHDFGRALVLVRSPEREHYQSASNLNPADFDGPGTVYAWDRGLTHREAVVHRLAERPVWVIGRGATASGFVVLAGPYPPGTVPP